jgi:energy-coupling factor transporter ATP-binding protein EcfA2
MEKSKTCDPLDDKFVEVQIKMSKYKYSEEVSNFLLGVTGSGKSTFINYMMGVQFNRTLKGSNYLLTPKDEDLMGNRPNISHSKGSCTEYPEIYEHEGVIWHDSAGFLDTKGAQKEILNAYCNSKMFKWGHRARIILVIEQSSLYASRGSDIVEAANRLNSLFG